MMSAVYDLDADESFDHDPIEYYGYDDRSRLVCVWKQNGVNQYDPVLNDYPSEGHRPTPVVYERIVHRLVGRGLSGEGWFLDAPVFSQVNDYWYKYSGGFNRTRRYLQSAVTGDIVGVFEDNEGQYSRERIGSTMFGIPRLPSNSGVVGAFRGASLRSKAPPLASGLASGTHGFKGLGSAAGWLFEYHHISTPVRNMAKPRATNDLGLSDSRFIRESFAGRRLGEFLSANCEFQECDFTNMVIDDACFGGGMKRSRYRGCFFDGSQFSSHAAGVVRFEDCSFRDVVVKEWICSNAEFVRCTFSGHIEGAIFMGAPPDSAVNKHGIRSRTNEYTDNDFADCLLIDVAFRLGVDLRKQRLPRNGAWFVVRNADEQLPFLREAVSLWKDSEQRRLGAIALACMELEAKDGQKDVFVSLDGSAGEALAVDLKLRAALAELNSK